MDEQGMAVAGHQEASLKSRRKLAETTKGTCILQYQLPAELLENGAVAPQALKHL